MNRFISVRGLFLSLSFVVPFALYFLTRSSSLGFADAGEFALVTHIGGIAHPPGFPSYVLSGWAWSNLLQFLSGDHTLLMILFSITCSAAACSLLFETLMLWLQTLPGKRPSLVEPAVALISVLAFATGLTVWHWAHNIEVYAFHIFAMSLLVYGLSHYQLKGNLKSLYPAACGLGMALSNHHLTVIFFLPFIPLFFQKNFLAPRLIKNSGRAVQSNYFQVLLSKDFLRFVLTAASVTIIFYAWMMLRAGQELPFKFGNPDTMSRFLYHLSGGAWQKNTAARVEGITSMRFPYFTSLAFSQFFLFLPFLFIGLLALFRMRLKALAASLIFYFLLLFFYQLRIDQTADTDAYMLLPFFMMSFAVAAGMLFMAERFHRLVYLFPVLLALQIAIQLPKADKRQFDLCESLMRELDACTPPNSVLLISDWTLVSQFYYYHLVKNFRPDLVLLNYDIKFVNYEMLPVNYPEFYSEIKPEYDRFIKTLGAAHPQEIYNTGCTLDTPELMDAYLKTVVKIQEYCRSHNLNFMCDPKAFLLLLQNKLMSTSAAMSGFLVSEKPTGLGASFLDLPFRWLDMESTLNEPAAVDKIVDFEAALDFSRNYFRQSGDSLLAVRAETSYQKIKHLQRLMKKNMPFVYRAKEK